MQDSCVLSVSALCKHFGGVRALDGLDLQVRRGEILGIVGPNGAGKTALINTITGFYRATSGRILLDGTEITTMPISESVPCQASAARTPENRPAE